MDTRVFCVYNAAKGALLSSQVTVADGANQPLTILRVLVGGLAIDSKSGLWITPLHGLPSVPRLFPFDVIYLDEELRILELTEFVPGAEFPPYRREVTSALILPSQSLQSTQTSRDDRLLICPVEEMERQIAGLDTGSSLPARTSTSADERPLRSSIPKVEAPPRAPSGARFAASMKTGAAAAVAEEVLASASRNRMEERGTGPSIRKKWPLTPATTATDRSPDVVTPAPQPQKMEQPGLIKVEALRNVLAAIGIEQGAATVESPKTDEVQEAAEVPPSSEARGTSQANAPVISITEVILERPRTVESPPVIGVHGDALHGDIDDLFSNWMDTPSLASTWKPRSAELARQPAKPPAAPITVNTPVTEANKAPAPPQVASETASLPAAVEQVEQLKSEGEVKPVAVRANQPEMRPLPETVPAERQNLADAVPVQTQPELSKGETESPKAKAGMSKTESSQVATPAASTPVRVALPQPKQASTSTVAHYGLWRASLPTAVLPVAAPKEPAKTQTGAVEPFKPTDEVAKTATSTAKASTAKASAGSSAGDSSLPPETPPRAEVAVRSHAPSQSPLAKDAQAIARKAPVEIAKPTTAKTSEAVSRRPLIPDNFPAVDERRKPINKVASSAISDKDGTAEVAHPPVERAPDDWSFVPTRAAAATEAVDIVQRRLGIGQANAPDETVGAKAEKAAAVTVSETASAEVLEPMRRSATERVTAIEPVPSNGSSLAPSDTGIAPAHRSESNGKASVPARTLAERFKRWLNPEVKVNSDRRRAHRRYVPGMVAHYYTGGAPKPHDIADISMTGFYLLTEDRWMPDTMIQMTLQKPCAKGERKQSITVLSKIVRRGSDGVAAQFVMAESLDPHSHDVQPSQTTDRFALARFI